MATRLGRSTAVGTAGGVGEVSVAGGAAADRRPAAGRCVDARDRCPARPRPVDDQPRATPQRASAGGRAGEAGQICPVRGAQARRAAGAAAQAVQAGGRTAGPGGAGQAVPEVEPGPDQRAPGRRAWRRGGDAGEPRDHLPGAVRARPRPAAHRVAPASAYRSGLAPAPRVLQRDQSKDLRHGLDQRTAGRSRRPRGARPLGRRPDPGPALPLTSALWSNARPASACWSTCPTGTAPRPSATGWLQRFRPCPSSCAAR